MELKIQRKIWESLLYFLLALACILLIIVYVQLKTEGGRCIRNPKVAVIEHFEDLTKGNITCTCITDNTQWFMENRGYKIIFGSYEENEN